MPFVDYCNKGPVPIFPFNGKSPSFVLISMIFWTNHVLRARLGFGHDPLLGLRQGLEITN